jgi:aryl-alcohol dehydrogenase-like predicted oxidoreductase
MESRMLGRTGLLVSRIGLGLAALGRPGYINLGHAADLRGDREVSSMESRAHAVLDVAREAGVRYFDAARSYGLAESFLASWLAARGIAPGAVTVGSKWGYTYTAGWRVDADPPEVKDLSAETLARQLEETREMLGAHLSLYQIHSATLSTGVLDDHRVAAELQSLRSSGVAVGLSVSGADQAATILRALEVGGFDSVQATWNLLERSAGDALEQAHEAGLGVMVKEALANGRLTTRGGIEALECVAERLGASADALAIAAVLSRPWVDTVLSGASAVAQLESNLAATEISWDDSLEQELAELTEPSDRYWETRSALPWT